MDGVKLMKSLKNILCKKKSITPFILTQKYPIITNRIITVETVVYKDKTVNVNTEWDTGATYSSISIDLVQTLNLKPIKRDNGVTVGGSYTANVYEIIILLHKVYPVKVEAQAVSNINATGIDLLIGMDVISLGDFAVSNYHKNTYFSFRIPSQNHIIFK